MTLGLKGGKPFGDGFFDGALQVILNLQRDDGAIPWHQGGVFDPWNHIEAAMGLVVGGHLAAARKAYRHLADTQLEDGSWWGHYHGDPTGKALRDSNFCAYIATGVWHFYLVTEDLAFLRAYWGPVKAALSFVLSLQSEHGDIRWAAQDPLTPEDDALLAGCASIYKSLECAILIARALGVPDTRWVNARRRLGTALRTKLHRFDRTWPSKANFSMTWYYPVLAGVLQGVAARDHLAARWAEFVAQGKGCRCVQEQPWVTVAESSELAMALVASGQRSRALEIFSWQHQWRDLDGAYWMGYQYEANAAWPREKPAWTAAAVLLAADALFGTTPASRLFTDVQVSEAPQQS